MFIENTQPNTRAIMGLYLGPGVNEVAEMRWEQIKAAGYEDSINKLINAGVLNVMGAAAKVTIALVEKTYKIEVLEKWLGDARGPLKGAIKKQIGLVKVEKSEDADEVL